MLKQVSLPAIRLSGFGIGAPADPSNEFEGYPKPNLLKQVSLPAIRLSGFGVGAPADPSNEFEGYPKPNLLKQVIKIIRFSGFGVG